MIFHTDSSRMLICTLQLDRTVQSSVLNEKLDQNAQFLWFCKQTSWFCISMKATKSVHLVSANLDHSYIDNNCTQEKKSLHFLTFFGNVWQVTGSRRISPPGNGVRHWNAERACLDSVDSTDKTDEPVSTLWICWNLIVLSWGNLTEDFATSC
jgi:hypothetical protein